MTIKAALSQLVIFPNMFHISFWEERAAFVGRFGRFPTHEDRRS